MGFGQGLVTVALTVWNGWPQERKKSWAVFQICAGRILRERLDFLRASQRVWGAAVDLDLLVCSGVG